MTNRTSTWFGVLSVLLFMLSISIREADACSCEPGSFAFEFPKAAAVFSGTVQSISPYDGARSEHRVDSVVVFKVEKSWKGPATTPFILHVAKPIGDCDGFTFSVGRTYLVYAYTYVLSLPSVADAPQTTESRFGVGTCSRTNEVSKATEDIRTLDERARTQQGKAQ
jgi:hypothetical protein